MLNHCAQPTAIVVTLEVQPASEGPLDVAHTAPFRSDLCVGMASTGDELMRYAACDGWFGHMVATLPNTPRPARPWCSSPQDIGKPPWPACSYRHGRNDEY